MTMIKKLDKKTKILLLLIVTAAIGFMILSIILNYPLNSSLALLVGSFMLCAMVIQINLDKRFTSQQLARIQNRVNNDFLEINKGINSLTVQISDATVKARKQPFRLQTSLVSARKPTAHGRGAALVAKDPNRAESISSRILVPNDNILFSIGSQKMNMILGEQSNYPIVSVFPNSIVSEFQKLFESLDANATVVLVIEAKALSDGAWASSLSAAGSRLFTVLDSVIKELRDRGGFTFLVGEFKAKNTFTNSLADNVDSHITDENFKEDWALDASLSLPRALRSYALEGGNANE